MSRSITNNEYFTEINRVRNGFSLKDPNEIVIDKNAGQFVWGVVALEYKIAKGIDKQMALSQIFMCELFEDNCIKGIKNLYGDGNIEVLKDKNIPENLRGPGLIAMFKHNGKLITNCVQADALKYTWNFGDTCEDPRSLFEGL